MAIDNSSVSCRPYMASEIEVANLRKICLNSDGIFWNFDEILRSLSYKSVQLIYLAENDLWLGFVLFRNIGELSEVFLIYIQDQYRKQGHGRCLFGAYVEFCKKERVKFIELEVRCSNIAAIKLYEAVGMTKSDIRPKYYSDGEDALIYRFEVNRGE